MMLEILKGAFSDTSVEAVAGVPSFGGLCFLGFGGNSFLFFPEVQEEKLEEQALGTLQLLEAQSSVPRLVFATVERRSP